MERGAGHNRPSTWAQLVLHTASGSQYSAATNGRKTLSKPSADARLPDKHTPSWGLSHFYLNFAPLQTGPAKQVPEKPPQVVTRHDFTHRAAQSVAGRPKRQTPTPSGETAGRWDCVERSFARSAPATKTPARWEQTPQCFECWSLKNRCDKQFATEFSFGYPLKTSLYIADSKPAILLRTWSRQQ